MANFELGQGKQGFRKLDMSGDPAVYCQNKIVLDRLFILL